MDPQNPQDHNLIDALRESIEREGADLSDRTFQSIMESVETLCGMARETALARGGAGDDGPKANMYHDAGAIAQCHYCKRYTLDPKALSDRQPVCTCGKPHGWSGSFKPPGPDAHWHGEAPAEATPQGDGRAEFDAWVLRQSISFGHLELAAAWDAWQAARAPNEGG